MIINTNFLLDIYYHSFQLIVPILDKLWMTQRGNSKYIEGVGQFVKFDKEHTNGEVLFPCTCDCCKNSKGQTILNH